MLKKTADSREPQRLHLVFGGELTTLEGHEFRDPGNLDLVGIFPSYEAAFPEWKAAAQRTVDNALMRYVIVPIHQLLDPPQNMPAAPFAKAASGP